MKVLAFGCIHLQPRPTFGTGAIEPSIQWLLSVIMSERPDCVVMLGDSVESVLKSDLLTYSQLRWVLESFRYCCQQLGTKVFWLVGNHDIYSPALSVLDLFDDQGRTGLTVIKKSTMVQADNANLVFMPYESWMDDATAWQDTGWANVFSQASRGISTYCFSHVPIAGEQPGESSGCDPREMAMHCDVWVAGHYHVAHSRTIESPMHGTVLVAPGCLVAHHFGDTGWFHGATLLDTSGQTGCRFIMNPHSPVFYVGSSADLQAALQDPTVAALAPRVHAKVDEETLVSLHLASVELRRTIQVERPNRPKFKLASSPMNDLDYWLQLNGIEDREALLKEARSILVQEEKNA